MAFIARDDPLKRSCRCRQLKPHSTCRGYAGKWQKGDPGNVWQHWHCSLLWPADILRVLISDLACLVLLETWIVFLKDACYQGERQENSHCPPFGVRPKCYWGGWHGMPMCVYTAGIADAEYSNLMVWLLGRVVPFLSTIRFVRTLSGCVTLVIF